MDRSDITLERMRTFVRVAERGSLSGVAREMNIGQSSVTRHLRELEEALGVVLLSRTTRRVTLTEEGSRYYANAVQILRLVEQAKDGSKPSCRTMLRRQRRSTCSSRRSGRALRESGSWWSFWSGRC